MALIRVILGGCGIAYKDAAGNMRHVLKTPQDGPFECEDKHAASLVKMGRAAYVQQPQQEPEQPEPSANSGESSGDSGKLVGHLEPAELELMTVENLKKLAADIGLDISQCKKKADFVAAIAAVEVEVDAEGIEEDPDDEDALPDLSAADPE